MSTQRESTSATAKGDADSPPIPDLPGHRYRFIRELGAGGMGRVALVEDLVRGVDQVALKWLEIDKSSVANVERHQLEFIALTQFRHPRVLRGYEYHCDPKSGLQWFTSEFLAGPRLDELIERSCDPAPKSRDEWSRLALLQILDGLDYLHHQGWIHGDLKPQNVLLREPYSTRGIDICLIDFGLAKRENHDTDRRVVGTVHYMPPERFRGEPLGRRSDLYSFGVMLYQLTTGRLPFDGERKLDVIERHLEDDPVPPREWVPAIDPKIEQLTLELLAKNPDERPGSVRQVRRRLREIWSYAKPLAAVPYLGHGLWPGWEAPLQSVVGRMVGRTGDDRIRAEVERSLATHDDHFDIVPLRVQGQGEKAVGLTAIRASSRGDVHEFRELVVRQVRGLSLTGIEVRSGASAFRSIAREVAAGASERPPTKLVELAGKLDSFRGPLPHAARELLTEFARLVHDSLPDRPPVYFVDSSDFADPRVIDFALVHLVGGSVSSLGRASWSLFEGPLPDDRTPIVDELIENGVARRVLLPRLRPEGQRRWRRLRLGDSPLLHEVEDVVELETAGSPAAMSDFLLGLGRSGAIEPSDEGWTFSRGLEGDGNRRDDALLAELASLPADELRVLRAILAIGASGSDLEVIAVVTEIDPDRLRLLLSLIEDRGWIERVFGADCYRIPAIDMRRTIREQCPDHEWQTCLRGATQWFEQHELDRSTLSLGRIADYWLRGGERTIAAPIIDRWRRVAENSGEWDQAYVAVRRLRDHFEWPDAQRIEWDVALAEFRSRWGPIDVARDDWMTLLEGMIDDSNGGSTDALIEVLSGAALTRALAGDLDPNSRSLETALSAARDAELIRTYWRIFLARAELLLIASEPVKWAELPVTPGSRPDEIGWEAELRATQALLEGQRALATEIWRKALVRLENTEPAVRVEEGEAKPGVSVAAWSAYLLGRTWEHAQKHELATAAYRLAAERFEACGRFRLQLRSIVRLATASLRDGSPQDAARVAERAGPLLARFGGCFERVWLRDLESVLGSTGSSGLSAPVLPAAPAAQDEPERDVVDGRERADSV